MASAVPGWVPSIPVDRLPHEDAAMQQQQSSIAIDMDETVADTLSRYLEWYERDFGIRMTPAQTAGHKIYHIVDPEHAATVRAYAHHPDFFRDLPVYDDAVEVIRALAAKYDIYFASAAMEFEHSFTPKFDWLREHFAFIDPMHYIFCGHKGILHTDYLIDDHTEHLDSFSGQGLLYTAQHNLAREGYLRVDNWLAVAKYFDL